MTKSLDITRCNISGSSSMHIHWTVSFDPIKFGLTAITLLIVLPIKRQIIPVVPSFFMSKKYARIFFYLMSFNCIDDNDVKCYKKRRYSCIEWITLHSNCWCIIYTLCKWESMFPCCSCGKWVWEKSGCWIWFDCQSIDRFIVWRCVNCWNASNAHGFIVFHNLTHLCFFFG